MGEKGRRKWSYYIITLNNKWVKRSLFHLSCLWLPNNPSTQDGGAKGSRVHGWSPLHGDSKARLKYGRTSLNNSQKNKNPTVFSWMLLHGIIPFVFVFVFGIIPFLKYTNRIYTSPYINYVVFSFLWTHFIISHLTYGYLSSKLNMLLFSEWINYCIFIYYLHTCTRAWTHTCERERWGKRACQSP